MEQRLQKIEKEISLLQERNKRVDEFKAWETSWTRVVVVGLLTYIVMVAFFSSAGLSDPWLNALVPSFAFVLSTLSLPLVKRWWLGTRK